MSVEYLGTMNNLITIPELGELIGNTNANQGDITWLKFKVDNKILLVSKSIIGVNVSWDKYNSLRVVTGKKISIKGIDYKCRFLTGGNGNPSIDDNSEWKKLMVDFYSQTNIIVNSTYTMCQETYYNNDASCVIRGADSIDKIAAVTKTTSANQYGFRPVLETIDSFGIVGISEDFGDITSFNQFNYAVTNLNGGSFDLTEKVDGKVIRALNNQSNGEFTFKIDNFDSLSYGNHTIEIIADDPTTAGNATVTSKFNKLKSPVQSIPTNSNLKQVMLHNKELEKEISYQNFRLSEKLKENGIAVYENESLSKLISKIELEKHKNMPIWYNLSDVWVSDKTENVSDDDVGSNKDQTTVGNKIYVFGVRKNKTTDSWVSTKCYDAITNTWSTKADMPTSRGILNTIANGNLIYVIGGYNDTKKDALTTVECYDTITDTWSTKKNLLSKRYGVALNVYNNKIYCIGGTNNDVMLNLNECYDIESDTWSTKTPISRTKANMFSSVYNGKIYCIGGHDHDKVGSIYFNSFNVTECYDIESDTWSFKSNMPSSKSGNNGVLINDNIYCFGGMWAASNNLSGTDTLYVYNITNDNWTTKTKCPYPGGNYPVTSVRETCYSLSTSKAHMYLI